MIQAARAAVLPESQRRTLEELRLQLDHRSGDREAKRSAFWTMLTLSAVIASAGVLADSTATVIGAMIIAPLATPIMGMALGVVTRGVWHAIQMSAMGAGWVLLIGILAAQLILDPFDPLDNAQIAGRTSPALYDLIAAVATGLAGAIGMARRDVAAVLPGVAISISLVPPLAVAGLCLGEGEVHYAIGAFALFLSNLVALVLTGTLVFAALGYAVQPEGHDGRIGSSVRARLTLAGVAAFAGAPLILNTSAAYTIHTWTNAVETHAAAWIAGTPTAEVTDVDVHGVHVVVSVQTPGELPPMDDLLLRLDGEVPKGLLVRVRTQFGEEVPAGQVGDVTGARVVDAP